MVPDLGSGVSSLFLESRIQTLWGLGGNNIQLVVNLKTLVYFTYNLCKVLGFDLKKHLSVNINLNFVNSLESDENDNQLKFSAGFASYIKASILSVNDDNMTTDYLTCLSNDKISKTIFPDNKNNSFVIQGGGLIRTQALLLTSFCCTGFIFRQNCTKF